MPIRLAHISDLHIACPPDSDPEGEVAYFEALAKRALPVAVATAVITALAHPRTREAVLDGLNSARGRVAEIDRTKIGLILAGLGAAGVTLAIVYRRKLMQLWLSLRGANQRVRARLLEDLANRSVDHVVISGDMTNVASRDEFNHARAFVHELQGAARGASITLVPGNHDVGDSHPRDGVPDLGLFHETFGDWLGPGHRYPHLQQVERLSIVGLNSCTPGKGFGTRGRIGAQQLGEVDRLLASADPGPRVLVLHHHLRRRTLIDPGMPPLDDASDLLDLAGRLDVCLVLHGHQHTLYEDEKSPLPLVCAGSTTLGGGGRKSKPGYRIFEIGDDGALASKPDVIRLER